MACSGSRQGRVVETVRRASVAFISGDDTNHAGPGALCSGKSAGKYGVELMNKLQIFLANNGIDERAALNRLQDAGAISDNCVHASDVAAVDVPGAIKLLLKERTFSNAEVSDPHRA